MNVKRSDRVGIDGGIWAMHMAKGMKGTSLGNEVLGGGIQHELVKVWKHN